MSELLDSILKSVMYTEQKTASRQTLLEKIFLLGS